MLFLRDVLKINSEKIEKAHDQCEALLKRLCIPSYELEAFDRKARELITASTVPWDKTTTEYFIDNIYDAASEVIHQYYPKVQVISMPKDNCISVGADVLHVIDCIKCVGESGWIGYETIMNFVNSGAATRHPFTSEKILHDFISALNKLPSCAAAQIIDDISAGVKAGNKIVVYSSLEDLGTKVSENKSSDPKLDDLRAAMFMDCGNAAKAEKYGEWLVDTYMSQEEVMLPFGEAIRNKTVFVLLPDSGRVLSINTGKPSEADAKETQETVTLHARVTREITVTKAQAEALAGSYISGTMTDAVKEVLAMFTAGVNSGSYEPGYLPFEWATEDLKNDLKGEVGDVFRDEYSSGNLCIQGFVDL